MFTNQTTNATSATVALTADVEQSLHLEGTFDGADISLQTAIGSDFKTDQVFRQPLVKQIRVTGNVRLKLANAGASTNITASLEPGV